MKLGGILRERTNCKNCGAVLHYDNTGKAKCEYCFSEYFIEGVKQIEKPKIEKSRKVVSAINKTPNSVELELFGKKMRFYIAHVEAEPVYYIDPLRRPQEKFKLTLISY